MLENINFNKLKNQIKLYKNKFKKQVITLGLSLVMVTFTGCSETIPDEPLETVEETKLGKKQDEKFISQIKRKICENYIDYYETYEIDYNLEEYLISEDEVNELIEKCKYIPACDYDASYDMDILFNTIKSNSNEYIKENSNYISIFMQDSNGDNNLAIEQYLFETYLQKALNKYIETATNDIDEDIHKMQTLKFVYDTSKVQNLSTITLGEYDYDNNVIIIYRDAIKYAAKQKDIKTQYVLYCTIIHELNHVRQHKCDCRINEENDYKYISYDEKNLCTLLETSAESEIYNLDKQLSYLKQTTNDYSYILERDSEALLFLLAIFNEDAKVEDYYNAIFDSNWIELMQFYDLEEEEKYTFFKSLYIIDALNYRNDLAHSYYTEEQIKEGVTLQQFQIELGYGYKTEIFRMCLSNLIEYTKKHEDLDLLDNLMIFNLIKNKIVNNSYIVVLSEENIYERDYDENFVNEVFELENKYVEFLTKYYKINEEEIRELEKDEIYWYGINLTNQVTGNINTYSRTYDEKSKQLLNKFPILQPILYTNYYYMEYYNLFKDEENVKQKIKVD